jgi:flagellar hook-associated protein 3 FlgL
MRMSSSMLAELSVNSILQEQTALSKTQGQLSSGKRVQTPSDDPVAAVQLAELNTSQLQTTQYTSNGTTASGRLTLEEQALSDSTTTLQSIRDLVVQANSGTNNPSDLAAIATQIKSLQQQLLGIANRQDAQGEYLFSGYSTGTTPFQRGSSGAVSYLGDTGTRSIALDADTSVQMGDAGSSVFMNIPAGNGVFTTAAGAGNTGTGVIDTGSVTDQSSWTPGQYTIMFTDATHWKVTDGSGNPVTDAAGNPITGTYDPTAGGSVAFKGIQVGITGAPAAGDTFTVSSAGQEGVFATLDKLTAALNGVGSTPAARALLTSQLNASLGQIDQAANHLDTASASVGGRLNLITSVKSSLSTQSTTVAAEMSTIGDVDYVAATTQYSQEYTSLQAAESAYAKTAQLSLFSYL